MTLCKTTLQLYGEVQHQWSNVCEQPESEEADTSAYHGLMINACFNLGFEVSQRLCLSRLKLGTHCWAVWVCCTSSAEQLTLSHFARL